jgi:hypothetical protein
VFLFFKRKHADELERLDKKHNSELKQENDSIRSDIILWASNYRNKILGKYAGNHGIDFSIIDTRDQPDMLAISSSSTSHTRIGVYLSNDWPAPELESYLKETSSFASSSTSPSNNHHNPNSTPLKSLASKLVEAVEVVERERDDKIEKVIRKFEAQQVFLNH